MEDLDLVRRLEAAAVRSWPATVQRLTPEGWLLRATPGLDRGRSNNALTPCRQLDPAELPLAIDRVRSFAREHSIRPGIQVSPTSLHADLQGELDRQGWGIEWPTLVLTGPAGLQAPSDPALTMADHATPAWLRAWGLCEPGRDVGAHARTVFELLRGRAAFARIGAEAVGILAETDGLAGMFCLAVDPSRRRGGLGTALVRGLLSRAQARLAYLQVEEGNHAARGLYGRLGFAEAYRYSHRTMLDSS
jgi:N-acetylglutamate synthase